MTHKLNEFDPYQDFPPDFITIIYGKRRTGKNTMMLHMLEQMQERFKEHEVYVVSGTARAKPLQWKYFPVADIHADLSSMNDYLSDLLDTQIKAIKNEVKRQILDGMKKKKSDKEDEAPQAITAERNHPVKGKRRLSKANDKTRKSTKFKPAPESDFSHLRRSEKRSSDGRLLRRDHNVDRGDNVRYTRGRLRENRNLTKMHRIPEGLEADDSDDPDNSDNEETVRGAGQRITDAHITEKWRTGDVDEKSMPRKLIIFDDCVDSDTIRHSEALRTLAISGRHYYFSVFIMSHCVCGSGSVPPAVRINVDNIIVMYNPTSTNERKLLKEQYLSPGFHDTNAGLRALADITREQFRAAVIDVNANNGAQEFNKFLFTYGPVPEPPDHVSDDFRIGTEEQWNKDVPGTKKPRFTKDDMNIAAPTPPIHKIDAGRFHTVKTEMLNGNPNSSDKFFNTVF